MDVDLNCDLGEGGPHDAELLRLVTSANVACGFHAGDPPTARAVLRLARQLGVHVGAHPSFPDREHFGRRELHRDEADVLADCLWQVGGLSALAETEGVQLTHLKPHGALYHQACRDDAYARPVVAAAEHFRLAVVGLPGSRLEACAQGHCSFVAEGFADRRYLPDGSLVPRSQPNALIDDPAEAADQAIALICRGLVRTICVHGDNPQALAFVEALRLRLERAGHRISSAELYLGSLA